MSVRSVIQRWAAVAALGSAYYVVRMQSSVHVHEPYLETWVELVPLLCFSLACTLLWFRFLYSEDWDWQTGRVKCAIFAATLGGVATWPLPEWLVGSRHAEYKAANEICRDGRAGLSLAARRKALVKAEARLADAWRPDAYAHECAELTQELTALEKHDACPEFLLADVPCSCGPHSWPNDAAGPCPVPVCYPDLPNDFPAGALNWREYEPTLQCRQHVTLDAAAPDRSGKPLEASST